MATTKHVYAYIAIVVFVTWLGNGLIPEIQAGTVPIPPELAWLVRSLVPGLVMLCALLPSVVGRPPGVPDVPPTTVSVTPPSVTAGNKANVQQIAHALIDSLPGQPSSAGVAPPLSPTPPAPAIDPGKAP